MKSIGIRFLSLLMAAGLMLGGLSSCVTVHQTVTSDTFNQQHFQPKESNGTTVSSRNFTITPRQLDLFRYTVGVQQVGVYEMYRSLYGNADLSQFGLAIAQYRLPMVSGFELPASYSGYVDYALPYLLGSGYFDKDACLMAERVLAYCEVARDAGIYDALKADTTAQVDASLRSLKDEATRLQVSFEEFLGKWVGIGVTEADVRAAYEFTEIASAYATQTQDALEAAVTDAELEAYHGEHQNDIVSTYTSFNVKKDSGISIDNCKTADDIKRVILQKQMDDSFDTQYAIFFSHASDADPETDSATVREGVIQTVLAAWGVEGAEAVYTPSDNPDNGFQLAQKMMRDCEYLVKQIQTHTHRHSDAASHDPIAKWLDDASRKVGDVWCMDGTQISSSGTFGHDYQSWYRVEALREVDVEHTRDIYYVQLTSDSSYASSWDKASALLKELRENNSPERFIELVTRYEPSLIGSISIQTVGRNTSAFYRDWLFNEARQPGDTLKGTLKTFVGEERDSLELVYYLQENEETWKMNARRALGIERLDELCKNALTSFGVVTNTDPAYKEPEAVKPEEAGGYIAAGENVIPGGSFTVIPGGNITVIPGGSFTYTPGSGGKVETDGNGGYIVTPPSAGVSNGNGLTYFYGSVSPYPGLTEGETVNGNIYFGSGVTAGEVTTTEDGVHIVVPIG